MTNKNTITRTRTENYARWRKLRSRGFSTLEILIATVLIGTLVAGGIYYANIGQKVSAVELVSLKAAVVVRFPEAIATVYANKQTLASVSVNDLVTTGSVQANKPVTWVVSTDDEPTKNTVSLIFTLTDSTEVSNLQTYLTENIDTTLVSTVTVDGNDVVVKYEIT